MNTNIRTNKCHSQEKQKYMILLIVTDGMINDMEATKVGHRLPSRPLFAAFSRCPDSFPQ
jgi:hypothetical protein